MLESRFYAFVFPSHAETAVSINRLHKKTLERRRENERRLSLAFHGGIALENDGGSLRGGETKPGVAHARVGPSLAEEGSVPPSPVAKAELALAPESNSTLTLPDRRPSRGQVEEGTVRPSSSRSRRTSVTSGRLGLPKARSGTLAVRVAGSATSLARVGNAEQPQPTAPVAVAPSSEAVGAVVEAVATSAPKLSAPDSKISGEVAAGVSDKGSEPKSEDVAPSLNGPT